MSRYAPAAILLLSLLAVPAACYPAPHTVLPGRPGEPDLNAPPAGIPPGLERWIGEFAEREYPLYPGDVVSISVQGHGDLGITRKIPASGKIPLFGINERDEQGNPRPVEVLAAGKRVPEFEEELKSYYSRIVNPPYVTVRVTSYAPKTIYVAGAVKSPRDYQLPDDHRISLVQALTMAGWFTADAARDRVRVMRVDPVTGDRIILPDIDVQQILSENRKELDIPLLPGDTITVDSEGVFSVFVYGEVQSPGEYPLFAGMTLTQLITKAGGLKEFARTSDIRVLRGGSSEAPEVFHLDIDEILDGEVPDPVLKPGDVIHVDERFL